MSKTVIIPDEAPIWKAPEHVCEVMSYVTVLVVPSASDAEAVIFAEAPLEASSARVLASVLESVGAETLNSSSSVIVTDICWVAAFHQSLWRSL